VEVKAADKKVCKAMKGLIAEGQSVIQEIPAGPVRDAAIIGAADVVKLLSETYKEEVAADQLLSKVAEGKVPFRRHWSETERPQQTHFESSQKLPSAPVRAQQPATWPWSIGVLASGYFPAQVGGLDCQNTLV